MAHFPDSLWLVAVSVFVAGFIGSPHCMSMCGPIVMTFSSSRRAMMMYQLGRMVSYTTAGAILGAFGDSVLDVGQTTWLASLSLLVIAGLLMINGYQTMTGRSLHFPLPKKMIGISAFVWRHLKIQKMPRSLGGFVAGFFTVMIPCGHLYSFFVGAITTGSAGRGAVFMFAFWMGSAPLLSLGSIWIRKLVNERVAPTRRIAGALLMGAGLFSVLTFGAHSFDQYRHRNQTPTKPVENFPPRCH